MRYSISAARLNCESLLSLDCSTARVSARELHKFLEVKTAFKDWFPRMTEYGFGEGTDFNPLKIEQVQNEGGRTAKRAVDDAQITLDMAKELCMIQRNQRGKQARRYFLQVERKWQCRIAASGTGTNGQMKRAGRLVAFRS